VALLAALSRILPELRGLLISVQAVTEIRFFLTACPLSSCPPGGVARAMNRIPSRPFALNLHANDSSNIDKPGPGNNGHKSEIVVPGEHFIK